MIQAIVNTMSEVLGDIGNGEDRIDFAELLYSATEHLAGDDDLHLEAADLIRRCRCYHFAPPSQMLTFRNLGITEGNDPNYLDQN